MFNFKGALRCSHYRRLYFASSISEMGSFITDTALMLHLYQLTDGSKSFMGLSKMSFLTFLTVGSLLGGPIGEKYQRANVLRWCEFMRIPIVTSLFFIESPFLIVIINGLIAFFTGVFNPSRQAMTNDLLSGPDITHANSLYSITAASVHLFGPLIGASLFSMLGSMWPILTLDLLSYIAGIILLSKLPKQLVDAELEKENFLLSLKRGLDYCKQRADLRALLLNCGLNGFSIGVLLPLLLPFTKEVLSQGDTEYGILLTFFGLGGILGGFLGKNLNTQIGVGKKLYLLVVAEFLLFCLWNLNTSYLLAIPLLLIWGTVVFTKFPLQLNYISHSSEPKFLSRMHSLLHMAFIVPNILGTIIVASFADHVEIKNLLMFTSSSLLLIMIIRLFFKEAKALIYSDVQFE